MGRRCPERGRVRQGNEEAGSLLIGGSSEVVGSGRTRRIVAWEDFCGLITDQISCSTCRDNFKLSSIVLQAGVTIGASRTLPCVMSESMLSLMMGVALGSSEK